MPPTTQQQVDAHRVMSLDEMLDCVLPENDQGTGSESDLTRGIAGVSEKALIGPDNAAEGIAAGKMAWKHGFHVRRLDVAPGASLPLHARHEEEVIYLHRGALSFRWQQEALDLAEGDVLTVPKGLMHEFVNNSDEAVVAYVVRGGDAPAAATLFSPTARSAASN